MKIKSILAGVFAVLIWSLIPAFVKIGSNESNLSFLLVGRFLIASFIFLPLLKSVVLKHFLISFSKWLILAFILGANYFFQGHAMEALPASWYLIVFSLNPLLALFLMKTIWSRRLIFGILMSLAGTLMFVKSITLDHQISTATMIYMFLGMLTWVFYTVHIRHFQKTYSDTEIAGLTQFVSLIAVIFIWSFQGFPTQQLTLTEFGPLVALGVTTPIAYFLFSYCLRHTPVFGLLSQYLEPVFGVLIGYLFFKEVLSIQSLVGAGIIITGAWQVEKN